MHALFIVIAHAAVDAGMRTDRSGDERKRVALKDNIQRIFVSSFLHRPQICGYILMDRTAAAAGSFKAVKKRKRLFHLPARQRFDRLAVLRIIQCLLCQAAYGVYIHALPCGCRNIRQKLCDLVHPLVSARLKECGGHGDRPYARSNQIMDVEIVSASGIRYAKLSVKLLRDPGYQLYGQRIQASSGHIHLFAGKLAGFHIYREGIRELDADVKSKGG